MESGRSRIVSAVNGVAIKNLRHLVETLRDSKGRFRQIEFAGHYTETLISATGGDHRRHG